MWALAAFSYVPFRLWVRIFPWILYDQVFQEFTQPWLMLLLPGTWYFLLALPNQALVFHAVVLGGIAIQSWLQQVAVEAYMWAVILPDNPAFPKVTRGQWARLALGWLVQPIVTVPGNIVFGTLPRLWCAWHAFWHTELAYVTAPKDSSKDDLLSVSEAAEAAAQAHAHA